MALLTLKRREHSLASDCWCKPIAQPCPGGEILIHGDELSAHLGLSPILVAEGLEDADGTDAR